MGIHEIDTAHVRHQPAQPRAGVGGQAAVLPEVVTFTLQSGPISEVGVNGCQIDDVIAWCRNKLIEYNAAVPCRETSLAITNLDQALLWLYARRIDREKRRVEGTMQK